MALNFIHRLIPSNNLEEPFSETITIPSETSPFGPYVHRLLYVPSNATEPAISIQGIPAGGGDTFTQVPTMPIQSGEFFVDFQRGDLYFFHSDTGSQITINYRIAGSLVQANDINQLANWVRWNIFIAGVPQKQSFFPNSPVSYGPPLSSIAIPKIAPAITIKALALSAHDLSGCIHGPRTTHFTEIVISKTALVVCPEGGRDDTTSQPFLSCRLYFDNPVETFDITTAQQDNWRSYSTGSLLVTLDDPITYINVFCKQNTTKHGNLMISLLAA